MIRPLWGKRTCTPLAQTLRAFSLRPHLRILTRFTHQLDYVAHAPSTNQAKTYAILFILDSTDAPRLPEARENLHRVLTGNDVQHLVVGILANKRDLPTR